MVLTDGKYDVIIYRVRTKQGKERKMKTTSTHKIGDTINFFYGEDIRSRRGDILEMGEGWVKIQHDEVTKEWVGRPYSTYREDRTVEGFIVEAR